MSEFVILFFVVVTEFVFLEANISRLTLPNSICRKQLQQEFLDHGVLTLLRTWLEPLPDGSLPNINIRAAILKILTDV